MVFYVHNSHVRNAVDNVLLIDTHDQHKHGSVRKHLRKHLCKHPKFVHNINKFWKVFLI